MLTGEERVDGLYIPSTAFLTSALPYLTVERYRASLYVPYQGAQCVPSLARGLLALRGKTAEMVLLYHVDDM